jgi:hypothetical protein
VLKTRGDFFYAPEPSNNTTAVIALRNWLIAAGNVAEREFPTHLSANRS